mmetsp:Transcript_14668/g.42933  ORF Transcript_14668/g.42933 Transcript_14668/m.42933 type:complete len:306 (-) Transcript_14668:323-1240(-)
MVHLPFRRRAQTARWFRRGGPSLDQTLPLPLPLPAWRMRRLAPGPWRSRAASARRCSVSPTARWAIVASTQPRSTAAAACQMHSPRSAHQRRRRWHSSLRWRRSLQPTRQTHRQSPPRMACACRQPPASRLVVRVQQRPRRRHRASQRPCAPAWCGRCRASMRDAHCRRRRRRARRPQACSATAPRRTCPRQPPAAVTAACSRLHGAQIRSFGQPAAACLLLVLLRCHRVRCRWQQAGQRPTVHGLEALGCRLPRTALLPLQDRRPTCGGHLALGPLPLQHRILAETRQPRARGRLPFPRPQRRS